MPRVEFVEDNIKKNDYDYPKFKLEKKGETARVAILEAPVAEFVHNLRKPKLVGGLPQKETKTRKNGEQYQDYVYEFVSRPICLGDYGVLSEDGSDPDHCPICAEAKRSDRFYAPQRRFALHVVKYDTKPNSTEVKEPFGASTLVYSFTDKVFSKLFEFKQQGYDLRKHDLIFKAENPAFAGYDIMPSMDAAWLATDERKNYIAGLMSKDNLAPDLAIFCGSKKSEKQIDYDIKAINEAWAIATGVQSVSAADASLSNVGAGGTSLQEGLADLLNSNSSDKDADGWAIESPEPAASLADLGLGDDAGTASSPSSSTSDDDIDKLLNGI
jgi:hypothetical protein